MQITNGQRKGISPVIATVILIAITLIAAIAIAGFVFGLFGSFTSSARVSGSATCTASATPVSCTVTLSNTGTAATTVAAATITYGPNTDLGITVGANTGVTVGSNAEAWTFAFASGTPTSGESFLITVSLANGGQVPVSGTFS